MKFLSDRYASLSSLSKKTPCEEVFFVGLPYVNLLCKLFYKNRL